MKDLDQLITLRFRKRIRFLMSLALLGLLIFIALVFLTKSINADITEIAIAFGIISFCVIIVLIYKLDKDRKSERKAKDKLAANEIKYRKLIENAGIVMYTTTLNGDITFASTKAVQLTEYQMEELIGMNFSEIIDIEWLEVIKGKYIQQLKNGIKETLFEFSIRTKFGDLKWVEQSAVLIFEDEKPVGFQCIIKDITEKKQMEDVVRNYETQLVQNQERLQSILDNATSLIYVKDLEGKYLIANKQFKQVLNLGDKKIIGKTDFDFEETGKAKYYKSTDEQVIRTGKPVELEEILDLPDGVRHLLIVKFPLFNARNEIYGISGIATDITERVKQREELKEAKRIAENAKRLQEQFLANMSHEIRTPMNGIQGMTSLLLETPLNEEQRDFATTIRRSSENLIVIINDILDFSKIKSGKLTIENIDFNFNEIIENLKAIFRNKLVDKGLQLGISIEKDVPAFLNGDPFRLNQVLMNILGNAVKFTHEGGITLKISVVDKSENAQTIQFKISDTGIGIPADKIHEIFESFTQASVETSRKYGGSGLGLAITRQLVELQKGTIAVESTFGKGSVFTVRLPFRNSHSDGSSLKKKVISTGNRSKLQGSRILVAEDNDVNQKVIKRVLEKAGSEVEIVNNGNEAVKVLRTNPNFDLIIMDLQMPELDGYAATKFIRNELKLSVPIIAMTASALKGEKAKCLEIGMNDYLSKPFNFEYLYQRIGILLRDKVVATDNNKALRKLGIKEESQALFDISELEDLDDDDYLSEVISIFLTTVPGELHEMRREALASNFTEVYRIAHKLKSSSGVFKAQRLLEVLLEIEKYSDIGEKNLVLFLADRAITEFNKLIKPLTDCLITIKWHVNIKES